MPFKKLKTQKGIALALTLLTLAVLAVIGFGMTSISISESRSIRNQINSTRSYYLARMGVTRALSELGWDDYWGTDGTQYYFANGADDSEGAYRVDVWNSPLHTTSSDRLWKVTSTGEFNGASRTVVAWVTKESFASFAYFTNEEKLPNGNAIRFVTGDQLKGRVHTNGYFTMGGHPEFSDRVTSANIISFLPKQEGESIDDYFDRLQYDSFFDPVTRTYKADWSGGRTSDRSKYHHCDEEFNYDNYSPVALDDSPGFVFRGGQNPIPLPDDIVDIDEEADESNHYQGRDMNSDGDFGDDNDLPVKVTFNEDGTVDILEPTGVETETQMVQKYGWYKYNGKWYYGYYWEEEETEVVQYTSHQVSDPDNQGLLIHVEGKLEVEGGRVKGRYTLGATEDINIKDDVTYVDENVHVLGLVSENDIVIDTDPWVVEDIEIHASLMAISGSMYVKDYNDGVKRGTLRIFGGVIQNVRGAVGTGGASSNGTGYLKDYEFDSKLINIPPKSFPCTGNLKVIALFDSAALGNQ